MKKVRNRCLKILFEFVQGMMMILGDLWRLLLQGLKTFVRTTIFLYRTLSLWQKAMILLHFETLVWDLVSKIVIVDDWIKCVLHAIILINNGRLVFHSVTHYANLRRKSTLSARLFLNIELGFGIYCAIHAFCQILSMLGPFGEVEFPAYVLVFGLGVQILYYQIFKDAEETAVEIMGGFHHVRVDRIQDYTTVYVPVDATQSTVKNLLRNTNMKRN